MEKLESEYPTRQQIEECFEAYTKDGQKGILEFLKKQRAERESAEATPTAPESEYPTREH